MAIFGGPGMNIGHPRMPTTGGHRSQRRQAGGLGVSPSIVRPARSASYAAIPGTFRPWTGLVTLSLRGAN